MKIIKFLKLHFNYVILGVRNFIKYRKVIYWDRDWDYSYILELLKFKLKSQAKFIKNNGIHLNHLQDARNISICVNLIDKLQNDFYGMEYMDYYKEDYNFVNNKVKRELIEDNLDLYFKKYSRTYNKMVNGGYKNYSMRNSRTSIALCIGKYNHDKANNLLFKIMRDHLEEWWD